MRVRTPADWILLPIALMTMPFAQIAAAETTPAARPDPVLQERLQALAERFDGDAGFYVRNLRDGREAAGRADELFPTASLVKVAILGKVCADLDAGRLKWGDELTYDPARINYEAGDDLLAKFRPGEKLSLEHLVALMLSFSDNNASLWLQDLAGGGTAINDWLADKGFMETRVNSRTAGRGADRTKLGWGQTTPREMAELMVRLTRGELTSAPTADRAHRMLGRSFYGDEALSVIPATVQVASKQGSVDRSRSEVMLVHAPGGDYVFCLITKNQRDERYQPDNAGHVLLREASRIVWDYFGADVPVR